MDTEKTELSKGEITVENFLDKKVEFSTMYMNYLDNIDLDNIEESTISDEDLDILVQEIITNPVFNIDMYDKFVESARDNVDEDHKDELNPGDDSFLLLSAMWLKSKHKERGRDFKIKRVGAIFSKWEQYCAYLNRILKSN